MCERAREHEQSLEESLRSGVLLCNLVNKLKVVIFLSQFLCHLSVAVPVIFLSPALCHLSVSGPESSFCLRPCRVPTRSPFLPLSLFCTCSLASELDVDACVYMCTCTCVLQPGTIPKVSKSTMPFPMRENIKSFCDACRSLGYVPLRARLHAQMHAPTNANLFLRTLSLISPTPSHIHTCVQGTRQRQLHDR